MASGMANVLRMNWEVLHCELVWILFTSTGLNDCETVYWNCHDEHGNRTCNSQLIIPSRDHDTARFSCNIKDCNLHNGEPEKTSDALWRKFLGAQITYNVNAENKSDVVVWNQ